MFLYAAALAAACFLAWHSKVLQILQSVYVLCATWVASLVWFYLYGHSGNVAGYALIDLCAAFIFWRLSFKSTFTAPLFYFHAVLLFYYLWSTAYDISGFWVSAFINRIFEIALVYVAGGATYKIIKDRYRVDKTDHSYSTCLPKRDLI